LPSGGVRVAWGLASKRVGIFLFLILFLGCAEVLKNKEPTYPIITIDSSPVCRITDTASEERYHHCLEIHFQKEI